MNYIFILFIFINGCGGLGESFIANALGGFIGGLATNHVQDKIDKYRTEKELEEDALFEEEIKEDWNEEQLNKEQHNKEQMKDETAIPEAYGEDEIIEEQSI